MNDPDLQFQQEATLHDHLRIQRNAVGLALMLAGVVTFIIFHFLDIEDNYGWELWVGLIDFLRDKEFIKQTEGLLGFSGFITLAIGTLTSPCLIMWMIHNPWIKWCLAAFATMAAGIMWYFTAEEKIVFLLVLALVPTFTLAGLLCIKTIPRSHIPLDSRC